MKSELIKEIVDNLNRLLNFENGTLRRSLLVDLTEEEKQRHYNTVKLIERLEKIDNSKP